jgi:glycosyltransferase involved in cell wall biosynthesis
MTLYLVYNEKRYHKIRPLLRDHEVRLLRGIADVLRTALWEVRTEEKSVVMIDSYGRYAVLGLLARSLFGADFVVRVRGSMLEESHDRIRNANSSLERLRLRMGEWLIRRCLRTCDAIAYNSKHVRRKLRPFVSDQAREEVVYNPFTEDGHGGAATLNNDLPTAGLCLLTVTNMDFDAKINPTIRAVTEWMRPEIWERYDMYWIILGDGRHISRLRDSVREKELGAYISVPGWVDDPLPYYDWCDVYVHMTKLDAFPNVTMEAMSRSCPILTNEDSCGVREQVMDGKNGYLVESEVEFICRLEEYAAHPERRKRHGKKGKKMLEKRWTVNNQKKVMNKLLCKIRSKK